MQTTRSSSPQLYIFDEYFLAKQVLERFFTILADLSA